MTSLPPLTARHGEASGPAAAILGGVTTPPILPGSSPAARPGNLGRPGPSWPPADFELQDVWPADDIWPQIWGVLVITTPAPVILGGSSP